MLEELVRPFQQPVITGTQRIVVSTDKSVPQAAVLQWGEAGDLPSPVKNVFGSVKLAAEAKYTEVSRETNTVRVKNKTDPSQFVDVERIKHIGFKNDSGANSSPAQLTSIAGSSNGNPGSQKPVDGVPLAPNVVQQPLSSNVTETPLNPSYTLKPLTGDPPP